MTQRTSGIYGLLSSATIYQRLQSLIGRSSTWGVFSDEHIRAKPGDRVLDIGCGTAHILDFLPDVEYFGFDPSEKYIARARQRFGDRGAFWAERVSTATLDKVPACNLVLAIGVLHHLDDDEAGRLFALSRAALKNGGRLLTLDPCYTDNQSRVARMLIGLDRGRNIRKADEYEDLAASAFPQTRVTIRRDLLWIPWTHIILECER
ncbi:MAG: class I SAM-dependent methyltransferase [Planctomycetes bacterium]|nr:class I SAM-dependent methyltransferase [Planctomycetota bacterium]